MNFRTLTAGQSAEQLGLDSSPQSNRDLSADLSFVHKSCLGLWPALKNARILMTGGTGFIGCWLLEALRYADARASLGIHVTVLTRDPEAFCVKAPHLARYPAFHFFAGEVSTFDFPSGDFSHLIHAATEASAELNENNPLKMFDTILQGTRRALEFAAHKQIDRVLFLSSGAVYGNQPWDMAGVAEDWRGAPDCTDPKNTYAEAKRAAEMLCGIYQKQLGLKIVIARIFALLGPYLSLGIHFAAGNFILDAMQGKPIVVKGNGQPVRSYLYASDLTVWLLHLLIRAQPGCAYNVGSNEGISINDLARRTAKLLADGDFQILGAPDPGWNTGRYVPSTDLVSREFGLYKTVSLDDAILRTARWNGWTR